MNSRIALFFVLLALQGCAANAPALLKEIPSSTGQAIIVHPINQGSHQAVLSGWQKEKGDWHCLFVYSAVIGRHGLAAEGQKKEGDGKTPFGAYALGPAFGYASTIDTGLVYRQATDHDFWVDDVQSMQYNQWVSGQPAARSFERMKRSDNLYQYGVVINYNTAPIVPGAGSAIFMHVWRRYDSPTAGCVALNQRNLRRILRWLSQTQHPLIILE